MLAGKAAAGVAAWACTSQAACCAWNPPTKAHFFLQPDKLEQRI